MEDCAFAHMNIVIISGILIFTTGIIFHITFMLLCQIAVSCCLHINVYNKLIRIRTYVRTYVCKVHTYVQYRLI